MQFVVDSTGRAITSTIHDLWPKETPRLGGEKKRYYDDFVYEVSKWERRLQFAPARVGQCPMSQLVQQPVVFLAPHHS